MAKLSFGKTLLSFGYTFLLLSGSFQIGVSKTFAQKCQSLSTDYKVFAYGSCFVLIKTPATSWQGAQDKCTMLPKGRLATEINSAVFDTVTDLINQTTVTNAWVGGYDLDTTDSRYSTASYSWIINAGDHRPMDHYRSFWKTNQPDSADEYRCVFHGVGGWGDFYSGTNYPYICQYDSPMQAFDLIATGKKGNNNTQITSFTSNSTQIAERRAKCATACVKEIFCYSFSINEITGHCMLHWDVAMSPEDPPQVDNDYKLFSRVP